MFICNPNNPTGLLIEPQLMLSILKKCKKHGVVLVIDECFIDFIPDNFKYSMMKMMKESEKLQCVVWLIRTSQEN